MTANHSTGEEPKKARSVAPPENAERVGELPDAHTEIDARKGEATYRVQTVKEPETPADVHVRVFLGRGEFGFTFSRQRAREFAQDVLDMADESKRLQQRQQRFDETGGQE